MIIYNVTTNVDASAHEEWLRWMKTVHIPDVMNTGYFTECKMLRVLSDDESDGVTYSMQYTCKNMEDFHEYERIHAPRLRVDHDERYKDKFVSFRTLLEVID